MTWSKRIRTCTALYTRMLLPNMTFVSRGVTSATRNTYSVHPQYPNMAKYKTLLHSVIMAPNGDWIVTFSAAPWALAAITVRGARPTEAGLEDLRATVERWWAERVGIHDLGVGE